MQRGTQGQPLASVAEGVSDEEDRVHILHSLLDLKTGCDNSGACLRYPPAAHSNLQAASEKRALYPACCGHVCHPAVRDQS